MIFLCEKHPNLVLTVKVPNATDKKGYHIEFKNGRALVNEKDQEIVDFIKSDNFETIIKQYNIKIVKNKKKAKEN